ELFLRLVGIDPCANGLVPVRPRDGADAGLSERPRDSTRSARWYFIQASRFHDLCLQSRREQAHHRPRAGSAILTYDLGGGIPHSAFLAPPRFGAARANYNYIAHCLYRRRVTRVPSPAERVGSPIYP